MLLTLSACTNNFRLSATTIGSTVTTAPPSTGTGTDSNGLTTISRVVLDSGGGVPQQIDLIGDGSGSVGNICGALGVTPAASPCTCTLFYNSATTASPTPSTNGTSSFNQQVDVPLTYIETNLIRCSYAGLPSNVTTFNVALHLTTADAFSNQVTFNLASSGVAFDESNAANFFSPTRFQCRDIVKIGYMLDPSMYDPIQAEDPHLTYPLDFYTTNLGLSIEAYIDAFNNIQGLELWNCPSVLNPSLYLTGDPTDPTSAISRYNAYNLTNLNVYSQAPLGNSSMIYPPSGTVDRSTFYLSRKHGGAFTVPVNALMGPGINTSSAGATQFAQQPLGYGAAPIPVGQGTGTESCPDSSVIIPPGFHWMKLWLFRSSLSPRNNLTSNALMTSVQSITCNPGDWTVNNSTGAPVTVPVFSGCYLQAKDESAAGKNGVNGSDLTGFFYSLALDDVDPTGANLVNGRQVYLADRYLGSGECVRLQNPDNNTGPSTATSTCDPLSSAFSPGPGCNGGYDTWEAELPFFRDPTTTGTPYLPAAQVGCGQYPGFGGQNQKPVSDPFNLCTGANTTGTDGSNIPGVTPVITAFGDVVTHNIDKGGSRFDFLFVVSPPTITTADMQKTTSSVSQPYQPLRFKLASDCTSSDPHSCSSSNELNYNLTIHDIGTNDDPNAAIVFPVCVLQPN